MNISFAPTLPCFSQIIMQRFIIRKKALLRCAFPAFFAWAASLPAANIIINGGFETPVIAAAFYSQLHETLVPGFDTTATDNRIEIWSTGFGGVPSYEGNQFAEINATQSAALTQEIVISVAGSVGYSFVHRGRDGVDVLRVDITYAGADGVIGTGGDDVLLVNGGLVANQYSTGNTVWSLKQSANAFTSVAGGTYLFSFGAVSTANGDATIGNFIDDVQFGVDQGLISVPEPGRPLLLGFAGAIALLRRRRGV